MHYLTGLAGKLVRAYQDRDNLAHWASQGTSEASQIALVESLRDVLEQEVAKGNLHYNCLHRSDYPSSEDVLSEFRS